VPVILTQPQGQTVLEGAPVTFTVSAGTAVGSLQYQLAAQQHGLPGQTSPTLTLALPNFRRRRYRVLVSNPDASAFSAAAQLVVIARPQLAHHADGGGDPALLPNLDRVQLQPRIYAALVHAQRVERRQNLRAIVRYRARWHVRRSVVTGPAYCTNAGVNSRL